MLWSSLVQTVLGCGVPNHGIEVAVGVEVAEGDWVISLFPSSCPEVKFPFPSLIQTVFQLNIETGVRHHGIEVAVAVEVSEGDCVAVALQCVRSW